MSALLEREEWLQERDSREHGYIGASEVAEALGISAWGSPHDLWLRKVKGEVKAETVAMRRGRWMEPFIASEFEREMGVVCRPSRLYRHPRWSFIGCNPDREFDWKGHWSLLECKDVGFFAGMQFGPDGGDVVDEQHLVQTAYQLICTNAKLACLCAFLDGRELRRFWYTFDPDLYDVDCGAPGGKPCKPTVLSRDLAKSIVQRVCYVWDRHIVRGIEPPLSHTDSDTRFVTGLRATYENGELTNTDAPIDKECRALAASLRLLQKQAKVVDRRKNRIRQFMAERGASALESSVGTFTWRNNVNGTPVFNTPFRSNKA